MITVKKSSDKWLFLVNDVQVYSMQAQKAFGFYYGFYVSGAITIDYDYFTIKQKARPINLIEKSDLFGERENLGGTILK